MFEFQRNLLYSITLQSEMSSRGEDNIKNGYNYIMLNEMRRNDPE
jgi:hypothetical protein